MDLHELEEHFGYLKNCCLHNPKWTPVDVEEVLFYAWNSDGFDWYTNDDYPGHDGQQIVLVKLKNGKLGLLADGEDYTGHGCQCHSWTGEYNDIDDLLNNGIGESFYGNLKDLVEEELTTSLEDDSTW